MCVSRLVRGPPQTKPDPRRWLWQPRPSPGLDRPGGASPGSSPDPATFRGWSVLMSVSHPRPPRPALFCPSILTSWPSFSKARSQGPNLPKRRQTSQEKPKASSFLPRGPPRAELPLPARLCQVRGTPRLGRTPSPALGRLPGWPPRVSHPPVTPSPPPQDLARPGERWRGTGDGSGRERPAGSGGRGAGVRGGMSRTRRGHDARVQVASGFSVSGPPP